MDPDPAAAQDTEASLRSIAAVAFAISSSLQAEFGERDSECLSSEWDDLDRQLAGLQ